MPRPRPTIAAVTVAMVAVLAVAGCVAAGTADRAAPQNRPIGIPGLGWPGLAEQLADSWVEDGQVGYFVDAVAGSAGAGLVAPPFSLHETYWNVLLGQVDPSRTDRLAPERVAVWLRRAAVGDLPGAGLPPIGQISYATEIAARVGVPLDRSAVERSIAALRTGPLYRPTTEMTAGDWGSTALAVRALASLGLPVPEETARAARDRIANQPTSVTVQTVVAELVPAIEVIGHAYGRSAPSPWSAGLPRLIEALRATLDSSTPDGPVLATRQQLAEAGRLLGRTVGPVDDRWCAAGRPAGTSSQLRFYALSLGCAGVPVPERTPYSRAGWPLAAGPVEVLESTVAGARVAAMLGALPDFSARIATTLDRIWIPLARAGGATDATLVGRVLHLTGTLDRPAPADLVGLVRGADTGATLAALIGVSTARGEDPTRTTAVRRLLASLPPNGGSSLPRAAMIEMGSRVLDDPALHDRALAQIQQLALSPTVFAGVESGTARAPSLTASIVGAWIGRAATPPFDDWVTVGLCTPDGQCGETPDTPRSASLRTAMLVLACRQIGCGEDFPVPP